MATTDPSPLPLSNTRCPSVTERGPRGQQCPGSDCLQPVPKPTSRLEAVSNWSCLRCDYHKETEPVSFHTCTWPRLLRQHPGGTTCCPHSLQAWSEWMEVSGLPDLSQRRLSCEKLCFLTPLSRYRKIEGNLQQLAATASKPNFWYWQWVMRLWTQSSGEDGEDTVPGSAEVKQSWSIFQTMAAMMITQLSSVHQISLCLWMVKIFQFSQIYMSHILPSSSFFTNHQSPTCPQQGKTCCVWMIPLSWKAAFTCCAFICARKEAQISPYYKHQAHRNQRPPGRTKIQMILGTIWVSWISQSTDTDWEVSKRDKFSAFMEF